MDKNIIEEIADMPSIALERTLETTGKALEKLPGKNSLRKAQEYWHILGPGLTTGASDDDPSGIATYSQTGAGYGFQLLWLAAFTFPLMAIVQEMCARIGLTTGRGLAANIKHHFPAWVLYTITVFLFAANAFNIGADLGAMAQGTQLILPGLPFGLLVIIFTAIILWLQIFTSYKAYAKYLKYLALVLFAYVFSALIAHPNWHTLATHAVLPSLSFNKDQIILVCAILGTTISPYLFFWQTSQEVEEQILKGETTIISRAESITDKDIKDMRTDVWSGMFLSNVVMFFIISATATVLFTHGITNITTAAQAAEALRPLAGNSTYYLFALGIIGTGMLAIPVLAGSASYALSESFGWKMGLYQTLRRAPSFYGVIIISMLVGLGLNFIGLDPIKALIYSAVGNGLVAPVVLTAIILISKNKQIMGHRTNHPLTTWLGWLVVGLMSIAGVATIVSLFIS